MKLKNYCVDSTGINPGAYLDIEKIQIGEGYINWVAEKLRGRIAKSPIILPLSGGKDSTTAYQLLAQLFPREQIKTVFCITGSDGEKTDLRYATRFARDRNLYLNIRNIRDNYNRLIEVSSRTDSWLEPESRVFAREAEIEKIVRETNGVPIDACNKSEMCLGFFTPTKPAEREIQIFTELYDTEVRALGRRLGLPDYIVTRQPLTSETSTEKYKVAGGDFNIIDPVLWKYIDHKKSLEEISLELGHSLDYLQKLDSTRISGQFMRTGFSIEKLNKIQPPVGIREELEDARRIYMP